MINKRFLPPLIFLIIINSLCFGANNYNSQKIETIVKDQANYLTPENTISALRSALLKDDLNWVDETMTAESAQEQIIKFKEAGIDRSRLFDLEKSVRESYIVDKIYYKDAVLLIVEDITYSGSFKRYPNPFVEIDGKWKFTSKYSKDEELLQYVYYAPPLFDGKGQSADANSFLGYEQPTQVQTDLPSGSTTYAVHVYYGKTVNPATFRAVLNKQDISVKFTPKPLTDEEVVIPLQQGRNVLQLSVDGKKLDGKTATDSDRLVFIVP